MGTQPLVDPFQKQQPPPKLVDPYEQKQVQLDPNQAQTAANAMIYSNLLKVSPSYANENHDEIKKSLGERLGDYAGDAWEGLTKDSVLGEMYHGKVPQPFESDDEIANFMKGFGQMVGDLPLFLAGGVAGGAAGGLAGTAEFPVVGTISGAAVGGAAGGFALTAGMRQWLVDKYAGKKVSSFQEVMDIFKASAKGAITGAAFGVAGEAAPMAEGAVAKYLGPKAYKAAAELAAMTTVGSLVEGKVPTAHDFVSNAALFAVMHVGMKGMDFAKESLPAIQDRMYSLYGQDGAHPADVVGEAGKQAVETRPTDNPIEVMQKIDDAIARSKPPEEDQQNAEETPAEREVPAQKPPEPAGDRETGIKNAQTEAERAERGLPEVEIEAKRSLGQVYDTAKEQVDSGKIDPRKLAAEVAESPRPLKAEESAALVYDRMRLQNEHAQAMNGIEAARADGDTDMEARQKERLNDVEAAISKNDEAARKSGYEQGAGLAARRMMIKQDYSLSNLLQRARVASPEGEVTPELRGKLEDLSRQLDEANRRIDEYEEAKKQSAGQESVDRLRRQEQFKARSGKRAATKEQLKSERDALYKQLNTELMQNLSANPVFNPKLYELFGKLAANHVRDGIVTIEGIVDAIHAEIGQHGMSKREIRDYISQYGRESAPVAKSDIQKQLSEARRQGKLLSKIEDAQKGQEPAKGKKPPPRSERVKQLEAELKQAMKDSGLIEESDPQETSLKAYKTRLNKRISDLEKQLESGDYTKPTKRTAVLDSQAMELKEKAERLKGQIDAEILKKKMEQRTPLEKGMEVFQKWRRGILISSVSVGGKIANASMQRLGVTPIEEMLGGITSKFPGVRDIADKAPRHGSGLSVSAEAKALASIFSSDTAKSAWSALKTGRNRLDVLYGKKPAMPPHFLDLIGHIHGALQTPIMESEFARSVEKRAQWSIDHGLDIEDPRVQATVASAAYLDAKRAVFQQDNFISDAFTSMVRSLERHGLSGKATAFLLRTVLPIVRLPSNVAGEAIEYATGSVTGSINALRYALDKDAMANLTAGEADNILRALKKGKVGLAVMALGYYAGSQQGGFVESNGFYQPADSKDKGKKPVFKVGGAEMPQWALDTPVGFAFQIGATIARVNQYYTVKGQGGGLVAGAKAGALGAAKKVPFTEAIQDVGKAIANPDTAGLFVDDLIQSLIVPPDLRKLAKATDSSDAPRKPTNLVESIEQGIPGLRENVPQKKPKGRRFSIRGGR